MEIDYRDINPFQKDKKLYVPVKYIASGLNGTYSFAKKTNKTTIKIDGTTFVFTTNKNTVLINKKKKTMNGKAIRKDGFLFVPASVFKGQLKNTNVTVYKETCIVFRSKASEDSYTAKKEPIGDRVPFNRTWKEEL